MSRMRTPANSLSSTKASCRSTEIPGASNKYANGKPPFNTGLLSESPYWANSGPTRSTNTDKSASAIAEMRARPTRLTLVKRDVGSPLATLHLACPHLAKPGGSDEHRMLSRRKTSLCHDSPDPTHCRPWPLRVPDERASLAERTFIVPSKSCHVWIIQALHIDFPSFAQVNFGEPE
jgi:hypothetical protein